MLLLCCFSRFITFLISSYTLRKRKQNVLAIKDDGNVYVHVKRAKKQHTQKYTASRQNDILVLLVHIHDRSFSYLKDALDKLDIKYIHTTHKTFKQEVDREKKATRNIVINLFIDFDVYWHTNGKSGPWQRFFADISPECVIFHHEINGKKNVYSFICVNTL